MNKVMLLSFGLELIDILFIALKKITFEKMK